MEGVQMSQQSDSKFEIQSSYNVRTSPVGECILSMIFSQMAENHAQNTLIHR